MPASRPKEVRDIVIHQYNMGLSIESISNLTKVPVRTVQHYIKRYRETGTVMTTSELFGDHRGRPRLITNDDILLMLFVWTRDPTLYLDEVALEMSIINRKYYDYENLKYWKKRLRITRKKLWRVCLSFLYGYSEVK